ncbi:MAG: T9SS type A sorting domain-containing protein [Bacteroidales bacterium]|nr:T9SS type A sorting domain-containing protein [Bacteroidales bacterium]
MIKKLMLLTCCLFVSMSAFSQTAVFNPEWPETYVQVTVNEAQLQDLSLHYSVDKVVHHGDGTFDVRLCVGRNEYKAFAATGIPFTIMSSEKPQVSMASSYAQLTQSWNRYPTYSTYLATMDTFQSQFPQLCEIDTILAQTLGGHKILVAHISSSLQDRGTRPAVFYTSTIHGDEPVGYYLMLRLIHYLLHNYATDARVQQMVDSLDIWICPIENPDGTYHTSNSQLNSSPYSTRANYNGIDLNRSYPLAGAATALRDLEPEVQAMISFGHAHPFVLSANMHGGAEVFNYPWDTWTSYQRPHADDAWWYHVGRKFADTCHLYSSNYMTEENNGVTEGGDWYVITGSRQDYYNYYLQCREVTIEVSDNKVAQSNYLPYYWNYIYHSYLNFLREAQHGFRGVVTDSITGAPLEATVVVESHDDNVSFVSSHLPEGDYQRPIKGGTWQVTYSSTGYYPKTLTLTAVDGQTTWQNVQLVPIGYGVEDVEKPLVEVFPNPTAGELHVRIPAEMSDVVMTLYDAAGRCLGHRVVSQPEEVIPMQGLPSGVYLLRLVENGKTIFQQKILR